MEAYLEQGEVSADQLREPFKRAMREGHLVPIVFTNAKDGAGVGNDRDAFASAHPLD